MTPQRFQRFQKVLNERQLNLTLVMENVHKPHNFSAILRSCEAVGIHNVHAVTPSGGISQHHDTAAGANKWLNVHNHSNINDAYSVLRNEGFQILTANLTEDSCDFREIDYTQTTAIVMGSELYGISDSAQSAADKSIQIPIHGLVESLNVSVAAALILYEAQRQRQQTGLYKSRQLSDNEYKRILFEWCYPEIAKHHQKTGTPYPSLDKDGYLITSDTK